MSNVPVSPAPAPVTEEAVEEESEVRPKLNVDFSKMYEKIERLRLKKLKESVQAQMKREAEINEEMEKLKALSIKLLASKGIGQDYLKAKSANFVVNMYKNVMYGRERRALEERKSLDSIKASREEKRRELEIQKRHRKEAEKNPNLLTIRDSEFSKKFKRNVQSYARARKHVKKIPAPRASSDFVSRKKQQQAQQVRLAKEILAGNITTASQVTTRLTIPRRHRGGRKIKLWWYDSQDKCCYIVREDETHLKFTWRDIETGLDFEDLEDLTSAEFINEENAQAGVLMFNLVRSEYLKQLSARESLGWNVVVKKEPFND